MLLQILYTVTKDLGLADLKSQIRIMCCEHTNKIVRMRNTDQKSEI
jgi:hypothetical protein